ncbi:MAG: miaA [Enterovirga sp.]|nr:miaA [Enterovirga sp.]
MKTSDRVEAVLIAGPTASGKSALALRLAREHGLAVVNADSMQVYRDLRVLTARPSPAEEGEAPHRLFGEIDGAVNFSVGRYAEAARSVLAGLAERGERAILVGGTGLYFRALTEGLSDIPAVPEAVRDRVRAEADGRPTPDLHAQLARADPESGARLRPSDRQRILRALEVVAATGRSVSSFHHSRVPGPLAGRRLAAVFLEPDRAELRARIDRRFEGMMAAGGLDEVARLADRGLDPALPIMRAHGVPGLLAHLRGEISLAEAVARGQADTRAYAKRQATWFRGQMPDFVPVPPEAAYGHLRAALTG